MNDNVLLVGNGINNLTNEGSWSNLLNSMIGLCKVNGAVEINHSKPFPLLYEEIFLKSRKIKEIELKRHIAKEVKNITENEIHELIREKQFKNIITTNYDYVLQGEQSSLLEPLEIHNQGIIKEVKYSIFRNNVINNTKIWHVHGECNVPNSITLGYEHYGGQLQKIRNYVVSGTDYNNKTNQKSLSSKLKNNNVMFESWLDLFFKKNIHIIGLAMNFVETDLWWVLTYRARFKKSRKANIRNKITYYIPEKYVPSSKNKIDLLQSIYVEVVVKKEEDFDYYKNIITAI